MLGLMTVKRHREIVAAQEAESRSRIAEKDMINRSIRAELATLRATTQPRCPKTGRMMKRNG